MAGLLGRLFGRGGARPPERPGRFVANDKVRKALLAEGDNGTAVRHVIHFAYPVAGDAGNKARAQELVAWIAPRFTQTADSPGIVFEQEREVASADFDAMTERFQTDLAGIGWTYDGFECAVATGGARRP
ncbi:MAG: hypothetical protein ACWA5A_11560 [Marinibacterium sp.]